ncbi:hypothetical protein CRUP_009864 [Coryphaenoides rupestris]|nr:hypothetical protein CRUP_009864 [Coryphaenoides rupestris]
MAPRAAGRRGIKRKVDAVLQEEEKKEEEKEEDKEPVELKKDRADVDGGGGGGGGLRGVKQALLAARPDLTVVLNPEKPRRNSFEVTLVEGEKESLLWTGIKKGPPRKLKFPEPSVVAEALEDAVKAP